MEAQHKWENLSKNLELASSVDVILESEDEIHKIKQIMDISSRITKAVDISQSTGINTDLISNWKSLLEQVNNANSSDDILEIVSAFEHSMNKLREKRNPLSILKFEYQSMKEKAELIKSGGESVLINILPVVDDFERALLSLKDVPDEQSSQENCNGRSGRKPYCSHCTAVFDQCFAGAKSAGSG